MPQKNYVRLITSDQPGVIGKIGTILGDLDVNIAGYLLRRIEKSDFAYAVIKLDELVQQNILDQISVIDEIIDIKQLTL